MNKMKKKLFAFGLMLLVAACFAEDASSKISERRSCYIQGCKQLEKQNLKEAEEFFLRGVLAWIESGSKIMRDVQIAEESDEKNQEWRLYYYKGILELGMTDYGIFDKKDSKPLWLNNVKKSKDINANKYLCQSSFIESISLRENYQSHILLYFLHGYENIYGREHLEKAFDIARNFEHKEIAGEFASYIAAQKFKTKDYEDALNFYKLAIEYNPKEKEDYDKGISRINEISSENAARLAEARKLGFSSLEEYEEHKRQEELREKQRKARQNSRNLLKFLLLGKYSRAIPFEIGDTITVSKGLLILFSVERSEAGYLYSFSASGYNEFSMSALLFSKREISYVNTNGAFLVLEDLKIRCVDTASYKKGLSFVDTYVFCVEE